MLAAHGSHGNWLHTLLGGREKGRAWFMRWKGFIKNKLNVSYEEFSQIDMSYGEI